MAAKVVGKKTELSEIQKKNEQKRLNKLSSLKNEFEGGKIKNFSQVFAIFDLSPLAAELNIPFYSFKQKIEDPSDFKIGEIERFASLIKTDYEVVHNFIRSQIKRNKK